MTNAFFVYGTLKRSQCRAHMWPAQPQSVQPAWTHGALFGRNDYPAVTPGDDRILGELWQFREGDVDKVLHALDQIEGTNQPGHSDLYIREVIESWATGDGALHLAHMYFYARDPLVDGFDRIRPASPDGAAEWPIPTTDRSAR